MHRVLSTQYKHLLHPKFLGEYASTHNTILLQLICMHGLFTLEIVFRINIKATGRAPMQNVSLYTTFHAREITEKGRSGHVRSSDRGEISKQILQDFCSFL